MEENEAVVRRAMIEEADLLSELAFRSKAYWGYDDIFMKKAREDLTVSEGNISSNYVYVMEVDSKIIGFFVLIVNEEKRELDSLFIEPGYIGKGYGRFIWENILEKAKEIGVEEFNVIADPHAEAFYRKMGAVRIGYYDSTIFQNRKLPLLKVVV